MSHVYRVTKGPPVGDLVDSVECFRHSPATTVQAATTSTSTLSTCSSAHTTEAKDMHSRRRVGSAPREMELTASARSRGGVACNKWAPWSARCA